MAKDEVWDFGLIDQGEFGYLEELFWGDPQLEVVHLQTVTAIDRGEGQILQVQTAPAQLQLQQQHGR